MNEMKDAVDALLIISNDKIKEMYSNFRFTQAFAQADDVLTIAAKGIAEIITMSGDGNVDFQDVRTAMTNSGKAIMGTGVAEGTERAKKASEMAINSPLLDNTQIEGAGWLLINVSWGAEEPTMDEMSTVMNFFQEKAGQNANLKFGWCSNDTLENKLSVTLIATGFGTRENTIKPKEKEEVRIPLIENKVEEAEATTEQPAETENTYRPKQEESEIVFRPVSTRPSIVPEKETDLFTLEQAKEEEPIRFNLHDERVQDIDAERDRIQKLKERMMYLKNLNAKLNNPEGMMDMEKEPAYMRKGAKLDEVPHSSESQVSKISLYENTGEDEKKIEFKNNSFLHDNVD
jgi:cell division protein FtsZ